MGCTHTNVEPLPSPRHLQSETIIFQNPCPYLYKLWKPCVAYVSIMMPIWLRKQNAQGSYHDLSEVTWWFISEWGLQPKSPALLLCEATHLWNMWPLWSRWLWIGIGLQKPRIPARGLDRFWSGGKLGGWAKQFICFYLLIFWERFCCSIQGGYFPS